MRINKKLHKYIAKIKKYINNKTRRIKNICLKLTARIVKKSPEVWCFVPRDDADEMTSNIKAVFDYALKNGIRAVILSANENHQKYAAQARVTNNAAHWMVMRASVIIADCGFAYEIFKDFDFSQKPIINVWHGIPLKNMFFMQRDRSTCSTPFSFNEREQFHTIASSKTDAVSMAKCFGLENEKVHITGLPRIDFLFENSEFMQEETDKLAKLVGDRKLILFAPTWRFAHNYYQFSQDELWQLASFLAQNNCVFGVREHFEARKHLKCSYLAQLQSAGVLDLSMDQFKNIEVLLKQASLLVTDYSSCHFDFMYLRKPTLCFAYDLDKYQNEERGFLYPLADVFEHGVYRNFSDLLVKAKSLIISGAQNKNEDIFQRFYQFNDNQNTKRVFSLIQSLATKGTQ